MGERTYSVEIGTQRVDLPLVSLNEQLALALLITVDMGVEFMSRAGAELAEIIRPYDVDIVATVATMGIPVVVEVTLKDGHYLGSASLKQTDFGINPIRIAGGTVKVKDEVKIQFDIIPTQ